MVPSDVAIGPAGKVLLVCGDRLVMRQGKIDYVRELPKLDQISMNSAERTLTIDSVSWGTRSIVVQARTTRATAYTELVTHLFHGTSVVTLVHAFGESVLCPDAESHSAIVRDNTGSVAVVDLLSRERRNVPTAAATTCALTTEWLLLGGGTSMELWDRKTLKKLRVFAPRAGTTGVHAAKWRGARFGWLEAYEPMPTVSLMRARTFTFEKRTASPTGVGVSELNALSQVNEFDWDDNGKSYVLDRTSVRRRDAQTWTSLVPEDGSPDCYYSGLRISSDGAHTLMAQPACPPGGSADASPPPWIEIDRVGPALDLTCPASS
jgi:hypothetical protein